MLPNLLEQVGYDVVAETAIEGYNIEGRIADMPRRDDNPPPCHVQEPRKKRVAICGVKRLSLVTYRTPSLYHPYPAAMQPRKSTQCRFPAPLVFSLHPHDDDFAAQAGSRSEKRLRCRMRRRKER
jgi:hypothetical protein